MKLEHRQKGGRKRPLFFVSPISKTLTVLVKTRISVVNEKVATLPIIETILLQILSNNLGV